MERDARIDINRQNADMIVNQILRERESFARKHSGPPAGVLGNEGFALAGVTFSLR
jgi:hypothetical protein